ncbi:hypothetical protein EAE96_007821 [Botrytis aclada]|nr:hypothetical protein EAE96_007821 [Botrytis aclada]
MAGQKSSRRASAEAQTANKAAPLRKSASAPTSPHKKEAFEPNDRVPGDFPVSPRSSYSWLEDFWDSEAGASVLEFWIKAKQWYRSYGEQFNYLYTAYFVFFIVVTISAKEFSQENFDLISESVGIAGAFSESIGNAYLFESIPVELRDAASDLRVYHDLHPDSSRNARHHTKALSNLLSELDGIDYHWKSFENSRDRAITSVKEELQASRAIFQAEYEKLGGKNRRWLSGLPTQLVKRTLLRDPWDSKAHFTERNWMNSTIEIKDYVDVWRNKRIPELRYKFTSNRGGKTGGLPGLVKEVTDSWPVKNSGPKKFRVAPVYELEEVAKKAISLLGNADGVYKIYSQAIQFLENKKMERKRGFGRGRLEILLGKFDESIKRLEAAEWAIRERLGSKYY